MAACLENGLMIGKSGPVFGANGNVVKFKPAVNVGEDESSRSPSCSPVPGRSRGDGMTGGRKLSFVAALGYEERRRPRSPSRSPRPATTRSSGR